VKAESNLSTALVAEVSPSVEALLSVKRFFKKKSILYGCHSTGAINYCRFSKNLILIKPTTNCQPLKTAQNVATHFNEPKK
jgi:hypothetical protein